MTQLERAKKGEITPEMQSVAKEEQIKADELVQLMASGRVVIPFNPAHKNIRVIGIGEKLRTKVNVNIGTSGDFPLTEEELKKVDICLKYGTDTIMDLSTGGDIRKTRQAILKKAPFPLGTVPIYETAIKAIDQRGAIVQMTTEDIFQVIEDQAKEGVDFMTVHVGLTSKAVERLKNQGRVADIVSRGGAFHLAWILSPWRYC